MVRVNNKGKKQIYKTLFDVFVLPLLFFLNKKDRRIKKKKKIHICNKSIIEFKYASVITNVVLARTSTVLKNQK
jgi:hypothetical protein